MTVERRQSGAGNQRIDAVLDGEGLHPILASLERPQHSPSASQDGGRQVIRPWEPREKGPGTDRPVRPVLSDGGDPGDDHANADEDNISSYIGNIPLHMNLKEDVASSRWSVLNKKSGLIKL